MMSFLSFALTRLLRMSISLLVISIVTFTLLQLAPGSFADIQKAGTGTFGASGSEGAEIAGEFAVRYGDDVSPFEQYFRFVGGALSGDMGPSYKYPDQSVQAIIASGFPVSASLAIIAVLVALAVAIPVGVFASLHKGAWLDTSSMFLVTAGHSLPNYLIATFLVVLFAGVFRLLPASGWDGPQSMVLPIIALAIGPAAVLTRYVRSAMIDTLSEEYITAAYAKGGRRGTIVLEHALRNSLIPLVTVTGPLLAGLMTGTLFIETLFRIPGLGLTFTQAAASRDMPLLMGTTLFFAVILMSVNLIVDLLYGLLDPRIRLQNERNSRERNRRVRRTRIRSSREVALAARVE